MLQKNKAEEVRVRGKNKYRTWKKKVKELVDENKIYKLIFVLSHFEKVIVRILFVFEQNICCIFSNSAKYLYFSLPEIYH